MCKYLMLMIVAMGLMTGCSGSKDAELKGYVKGCAETAHSILDPAGMQIDDAKLAAFCLENGKKSLK